MFRPKACLALAAYSLLCGPPGLLSQFPVVPQEDPSSTNCLGFCSMSFQARKAHDTILLYTAQEIFDWLLGLQPSTKDKGLGLDHHNLGVPDETRNTGRGWGGGLATLRHSVGPTARTLSFLRPIRNPLDCSCHTKRECGPVPGKTSPPSSHENSMRPGESCPVPQPPGMWET